MTQRIIMPNKKYGFELDAVESFTLNPPVPPEGATLEIVFHSGTKTTLTGKDAKITFAMLTDLALKLHED